MPNLEPTMTQATLKNVHSNDRRLRINGGIVIRALLITAGVCCGLAILAVFDSHNAEFDAAAQVVATQMDEPVHVVETKVKAEFALARDVWSADDSAKGARPDASH
jgi:hypothetical protein